MSKVGNHRRVPGVKGRHVGVRLAHHFDDAGDAGRLAGRAVVEEAFVTDPHRAQVVARLRCRMHFR